jgi:hypothetical protein
MDVQDVQHTPGSGEKCSEERYQDKDAAQEQCFVLDRFRHLIFFGQYSTVKPSMFT